MGKHIKTDFLYDLVQEDEMKFMSEDVKKTIGSFGLLLCEAISLFYRKDAEKLFAFDVGEWAMVGCVYRYMWGLMQMSSAKDDFDIDIEYDRMATGEGQLSEGERLEKRKKDLRTIELEECENIVKCDKKGICVTRIIERVNNRDSMRLRPDIIVHRRGKIGFDNNGLWVEFKKDGCINGSKNNYLRQTSMECEEVCTEKWKELCKQEQALFDQAKVMFNSCHKHKGLHYQIGAMVMLRKKSAHVGFFSDGVCLCGVVIDVDGCEPMSKEDAGKNLWCRPMLDNGEIEDSDLSLTQTAVCLHKCQWT